MSGFVQHVVDILSLGSLYAIFALGIALIFGVMQLVNFAHGELIVAGAYLLTIFSSWVLPAALGITIVLVVLLALLLERVAFRPVRGANPATLLVTSFALSYLLQNVAILIFGGQPRSTEVSGALVGSVDVLGVTIAKLDITTIVTTAVLLVALVLFLNRTAIGVQMRAAAEDFRMARLLGVRTNRVIAAAFAISGLLAAVASILLLAQTGTVTPSIGITPVIFAFMATVIGGMGSLTGAVLGGYVLGAVSVLLQLLLPLSLRPYRDSLVFAAIFLVLVLRPQGLIVSRAAATRV